MVYAGDRELLMIRKDMAANQAGSGTAGGVFKLNEGDEIYVKVVTYNTKLWIGPQTTHFGAFKISARIFSRRNYFVGNNKKKLK